MVGIGIFGGKYLPSSLAYPGFEVLSLGMFGTLYGLFFLHGKQREAEREKRMQYWREQVCTTRDIVCSHEAHDVRRLLSGRISSR